MLAIKFLLLLFSVFLGYTLGYVFTETKYRLARYEFFQFQGFECRKCLSTHIAWVTSTFISLLFGDWYMFTIGLIFAGALFTGLYIDERQRTITLDEWENLKDK